MSGDGARLEALYSSTNSEHYTPPDVLNLVAAVLGGIDLDPCADPGCRVPAAAHYTAELDGLRRPWAGRVFMNPPYGRRIGAWVDRLVEAHAAGAVPEAIALVPARVDSAWWRRLASSCSLVLFWAGRLRFLDSDGRPQSPAPFPSALVYLGRNGARFVEVMGGRGQVWQRVEAAGLTGQPLPAGMVKAWAEVA